MPRMLARALALVIGLATVTLSLQAQEPPAAGAPTAAPPSSTAAQAEPSKAPADPIERIKEEALQRSQVMKTLSYLTDVIGPRLTGSPQMRRANEWTRDTMARWGLANAHLEPWGPFGRGWSLKRFSAQVVEPQCIPLIAYPKAWSPSIDGSLIAPVVHFDVKTEADFERYRGKLQGAIVLTDPIREVSARFEPLATRKTDKQLLDLANAAEPAASGRMMRMGPPPREGEARSPAEARPTETPPPAEARPAEGRQPPAEPRFRFSPEMRAQMELAQKRVKFLAEEGPALLVDCSRQGDGGTLFVAGAAVPGASMLSMLGGEQGGRRLVPWATDAPPIPPQMVMAKEHYNRLVRMIQHGESLKMAVTLETEFHAEDLMAYNTIAEIPGTDLADEVVMLGAHLDSWHSGTGATDNAAGVAVVMEAARILKTLDLQPRRTIRVGLWSGEEQGLLGSRAYVRDHFGRSYDLRGAMAALLSPQGQGEEPAKERSADQPPAPAEPRPEFEKFSAYFNLDNGTGKIRGVYLQGNEALRPIFRNWLQPFRDLGAATLSIANTGGTDHQSFDGVGLPGFQFIQDEIAYSTRTHHSNMDVYDHAQEDDLKQAAAVMAAFAYNTAMHPERLPRKPDRPARPPQLAGASAP